MDSSEVGKFGTLCLMKRLEPDKVVAAYPIDEDEISFGRDPSCSIRLYYDAVSAIHCKIVFHDRKAFLVVLGTNGLFVDGCPVFPSAPASASPVTVPLPNNSTIEIHKKRFQFCYPPKELRAALLATPSKDSGDGSDLSTPERARRKRALRMSMIQSAQVFTPRPSTNAQENLRILKTPIKNPFPTPQRARHDSSPLKRGPAIVEEDEQEEDEEEMEEDIVLVETNHPSVVEEDRDLVILERVVVRDPPPAPPTPQRQVQFPFVAPSPQRQVAPPQTPRRRPPRASLHRAALIRSAQRAAMRREMEREEEEEEVEEVVEATHAGEGHVDMVMDDVREEEEEEEEEGEDAGEHEVENPGPLSSLRKSLTAVRNAWPFRSSPAPEGESHDREPAEEDEEQDITEAHDFDDEQDENVHDEGEPMDEDPAREDEGEGENDGPNPPELHPTSPAVALPPRIPNRPPALGRFMTPQATRHHDFTSTSTTARPRRGPIRYSVGGFTPGGINGVHAHPQMQMLVPSGKAEGAPSGPRRVRLVEPWKVGDIVVPIAGEDEDEDEYEDEGEDEFKEEDDVGKAEQNEKWDEDGEGGEVKDERGTPYMSMGPPATPSRGRREKLSEEERQAIIARRRSALRTPDAFFGGKAPGSRRLSLFPLSPAKPSTLGTGAPAPLPALSFGIDEGAVVPPPTPASKPAPTPSTSASSSALAAEESKPDITFPPADADAAEDTSVLLARMKQMVEGARRRQSMGAPAMPPTPREQAEGAGEAERRFSLFAPDAHRAFDPVKPVFVPVSDDEDGEAEETSERENGDVSMAAADKHGDADVEMGPRRTHPEAVRSSRSQETPRLDGLRHMFAQPRQMATPRMDGVRGLFDAPKARGGIMGTPAFDGVGEMLATPEAFRMHAAPEGEEEEAEVESAKEAEVEMDVGVHLEQESEPVAREEGQHDDEQIAMHEDADEQDEHASTRLGKAPARSTRGRKPASTSSSSTPAPRSLRSTPKAPAKDLPAEEETHEDEVQELPAPAPSRVTRKPRLRSASADPAPTATTSTEASKSTRRTRKATASPPGEDADDAPTTTKRRTRRTPTPEAHTAVPPPSTRRRGKTPVAVAEGDEGDDPLDSIARAPSPEVPLPGPSVRRSARGKLVMTIKEEEEESPAPSKPAAARAVRGRRGGAAGTGIPRVVGRGASAGASARRVGASATRVTAASAAKGKANATKENTPERQLAASPVESEPAGHTGGAKSSIPRTATRGKATRSAGRVRASEEPEPQAKGSRVRARK